MSSGSLLTTALISHRISKKLDNSLILMSGWLFLPFLFLLQYKIYRQAIVLKGQLYLRQPVNSINCGGVDDDVDGGLGLEATLTPVWVHFRVDIYRHISVFLKVSMIMLIVQRLHFITDHHQNRNYYNERRRRRRKRWDGGRTYNHQMNRRPIKGGVSMSLMMP